MLPHNFARDGEPWRFPELPPHVNEGGARVTPHSGRFPFLEIRMDNWETASATISPSPESLIVSEDVEAP